jgi:F-type H+-transporting ATPase subunit beta
VAEQFTGMPGVYVPIKDTVAGFKMIVDGECDHIPSQAFRYQSDIESVFKRYDEMQKEE